MRIIIEKIINATRHNVYMPPTRNVTIALQSVGQQTIMADGSIVVDAVGTRRVWTATWDYVPPEKLEKLYYILRRANVVSVEIMDIDGVGIITTATVSMPQSRFFSAKRDLPQWRGVTLTITETKVRPAGQVDLDEE